MNILALDTSDKVFSAALSSETNIWYTEIDAGVKHSELLMECVDWLFQSSGVKATELNLIACMQGPGSFTGLRIGFSTAKGLGMALGIPITSIPTLDCLANPLTYWPGIIIPAIDSKRNCFYSALYRGKERLTEAMDATPNDILLELEKSLLFPEEPVVLTGSGASLLSGSLINAFPGLRIDPCSGRGMARELIEIAKYAKIDSNSIIGSGPVYIRKSDAEQKRFDNK